jgi:Protein of unknown function (DUF3565)
MRAMQASVASTETIVAFHLDEHSDWVAELKCGHEQRIERTPLWNYRYWLTTPQGRFEYLGLELNCLTCLSETYVSRPF